MLHTGTMHKGNGNLKQKSAFIRHMMRKGNGHLKLGNDVRLFELSRLCVNQMCCTEAICAKAMVP